MSKKTDNYGRYWAGFASATILIFIFAYFGIIFPEFWHGALNSVETTTLASGMIETKVVASPYLPTILSILGVIGVFVAASFYRKQAIAQLKQANQMVIQAEAANKQADQMTIQSNETRYANANIRYNRAVKDLVSDDGYIVWLNAITDLFLICDLYPEQYHMQTNNIYSGAMRRFSDKLQHFSAQNHYEEYNDICRTIESLLTHNMRIFAFTDEIINSSHKGSLGKCVNVTIPNGKTENDGISLLQTPSFRNDFSNFQFLECDFQGMSFKECLFYDINIVNCKNFTFTNCIISFNKDTRFDTRECTFEKCYFVQSDDTDLFEQDWFEGFLKKTNSVKTTFPENFNWYDTPKHERFAYLDLLLDNVVHDTPPSKEP